MGRPRLRCRAQGWQAPRSLEEPHWAGTGLRKLAPQPEQQARCAAAARRHPSTHTRRCCGKGPLTSSLAHPKKGGREQGLGETMAPLHHPPFTCPDPQLRGRHCGDRLKELSAAGHRWGQVSPRQPLRLHLFCRLRGIRSPAAPEKLGTMGPRGGGTTDRQTDRERQLRKAEQQVWWGGGTDVAPGRWLPLHPVAALCPGGISKPLWGCPEGRMKVHHHAGAGARGCPCPL